MKAQALDDIVNNKDNKITSTSGWQGKVGERMQKVALFIQLAR